MRVLSLLSLIASLVLAQQPVMVSPASFVEYSASRPGETWSGRAPVARLELSFDPGNLRTTRFTIALEPERFDSGNIFRDTNARRTVFEIGQYPEITFSATRITAPSNTLSDGDTLEVTVSGTLTLHGVSTPLELPLTLVRNGTTLTANGAFVVSLEAYGIKRPTLFGIVVDDSVDVRFEITVMLNE